MKLAPVMIKTPDGKTVRLPSVDTAVMKNPPKGKEDLYYSILLFLSDLMGTLISEEDEWVGTFFSTDVEDGPPRIVDWGIGTCGMPEHLADEMLAMSEKLLADLAEFYDGEADAPTISVIAFCMLVNPTDKRSIKDRWTYDYPVWCCLNCRDDLTVTLYDFEAMFPQAMKFLATWRAS